MYPQSALEGFAAGINQMLGVSVTFTSGQPCTDGKTVTLPRITGAITQEEFEALCGVALHEAAHVAIGSVPVFQRYARRGCAHADAMNAVLDVADETRVEHLVSRAQLLFYSNANDAAKKALEADAFTKQHPRWIVLAGCIFLTRPCLLRTEVKTELEKSPLWPTVVKVWSVLWKARTRRSRKLRLKRGSHATLTKLADQIVEILKGAGLDQDDQPVLLPFRGRNLTTDTAGAPVDSGDQLADHADGVAALGTPAGSSGSGQNEEPEQPPFDESTRVQVAATVGGGGVEAALGKGCRWRR